MNNAEYVTKLIEQEKSQGTNYQQVAWDAAIACVGWPYVFGARWQYCTPANRRARYSADHPTIKSSCKNYNGSGSSGCSGCKWYPGDKLTRMNDCRGFTYGVLKAVYNWELMGAGCTSQWNNENNWKAKGTIDSIPNNMLVCLFVQKGKTMEHTGFGFKGETVECSSGVQHFTSRKAKWTHWGLPACIDGEAPTPTPETKPTLRRGDKGPYVTLAQTELMNKGYNLGSYGVDGSFGKCTEAAVRQLQTDFGLVSDGVIGPKTWAVLDSSQPVTLYTVRIPHLTASEADALLSKYPTAFKEAE